MKKIILKSKSPEFVLRHARLSDAKVFFESEIEKEAKKNFMSTPKSVAEVRGGIKEAIKEMNKKKKPSFEKFAIEVNGECAGWVNIHDLNQKHQEHRGIIGYCLHKKFRGKGIMSKAVKIITNYAFKKYKLKRLSGLCRTFNKASARTMEKAGYKLEGIMEKNKKKNGKYLDDMIWAVVR